MISLSITRFGFLVLALVSLYACNEDGLQSGQAAMQDPRYEMVREMVSDTQMYYFTEFEGAKTLSQDSLRYHLRLKGEGQYVAYELYNLYEGEIGELEADVLETEIDIHDTVLKQKVRDQRFVIQNDSAKLSRFDIKHVGLNESYEVPVGDTTYQVYNFLGYAHEADFTPSHRIFWTQQFGAFALWYGGWNTLELTHTRYPDDPGALYALRSEVRKLLDIPFDPPMPADKESGS